MHALPSRPPSRFTLAGLRSTSRSTWLRLSIAAAFLLASVPGQAGQVRVNVANFQFTPSSVSVNLNDHVVWVWQGGNHTVTSGELGQPGYGDLFDTGNLATGTTGNNTAFTWKTDRTGALPYDCTIHAPDMAGTITVQSGSSLPVSDFRITEVLYRAGSGGADLIEITNMGPAAGDLGRYRIAISGSNASIPLASVVVPSAGQVTIQPASSGSNTATHIFLPSLTALPDVMGSVALYAPNTVGGQTSLSNATQIIDFVQYGATGQDNEATAIAAGLWTALDFAPSVGTEGHSIEFCGNRSSRGGDQWSEVSTPNFGSDGNCITPARQSTWGRIKSLYR